MYVYAGFLPPGRQDIYIYDRQNRQLYGKQVMIEATGAEYARDGGDWLASRDEAVAAAYQPRPLSSERKEEIDQAYADYLAEYEAKQQELAEQRERERKLMQLDI